MVTRPPATANPSQTVAAECSLSGSKNMSGSPQRFWPPFITAALKPPPIVVELVIGIGAGRLADVDLDVDDGLGAVAGRRHAGEGKMAAVRSFEMRGQRPSCSIRAIVLMPTSLAGFPRSGFRNRLAHEPRRLGDDRTQELKHRSSPKFSQ